MHLCSLLGCGTWSSRPHQPMVRRIGVALLLAAVSLFVFLSQHAEAQTSVYEKILSTRNVGADPTSLAKYLRELHPSPQQRDRVRLLIRQMGDSSFLVREDATAKLLVMPKLPTEPLVAAALSNDPEIRWRAQVVLNVGNREAVNVMHAVFQVIAAKKTPGVIAELLAAMPLCDQRYLEVAARRAIEAATRPRDAVLLRKALRSKSAQVRIAAVSALGKMLGQDTQGDLHPLLKDSEDKVKLAAAWAIANFGDRKCLTTLLAMLESDDLRVRVSAVNALRQLSGKYLGFAAYNTGEKQAKIVAQWKAWVDGDGRTAKLNFPLNRRPQYLGRILVCNYTGNFVTEFDVNGDVLWKKEKLDHPWGVQMLPNNHWLVAACNGKYLIEFDPTGKEVWRKNGLPGSPLSVRRLENGNTLVATGSARKVLEIAPDGSIATEIQLSGFMADARRLSNGLTLIVNYSTGEVVEVDRTGKIVWKIGGFKSPRSAQRLKNGNTLVCDNGHNRVVECDRGGKIVWKYEGLKTTYDCQRLPDGRTLIGDATGLRMVEPDGHIVWHRKLTSTGRIFAY